MRLLAGPQSSQSFSFDWVGSEYFFIIILMIVFLECEGLQYSFLGVGIKAKIITKWDGGSIPFSAIMYVLPRKPSPTPSALLDFSQPLQTDMSIFRDIPPRRMSCLRL